MGTSCLPGPKSRYIGLLTQEVLFLESRARYLLACSGSPGCHSMSEWRSKAKQRGEGQAPAKWLKNKPISSATQPRVLL